MALHIEKYGTKGKQALTLIHGWGMHSGVWQPILNQLTPYYQLHCIDLPGMGFSDTILPYSLANLSSEIRTFLPENTHLLGWSLGGQVAMQIAIDAPNIISKLVLVGATPKFTLSVDWASGVTLQSLEKFARDIDEDYMATMLNFLSLQCMGAENRKDTIRILREAFLAKPVPNSDCLKQALVILETTDLRLQLKNIQSPTLILHGERDGLSPIKAGDFLARTIRLSQFKVFAKASHAPFLSHPLEFSNSLNEFLL